MKKISRLLLVIALAFSSLTVFASYDENGEWIGNEIPDDVFEGDFAEYHNSDGSTTKVFDSGSIITTNPDGTKTASDYLGNEYFKDEKGNYEIHFTDGTSASALINGDCTSTDPKGDTIIEHPDGTISEHINNLDLCLDYNKEGTCEGIGFIGDTQRIPCDDYGFYNNGEIRTEDGRTLQITDDGIKCENKDKVSFNFTESGTDKNITLDFADGAHCEVSENYTWKNGEKTTDSSFYLNTPKDGIWEANMSLTYDRDGKPYYSNNNVMQWTSPEGEKCWMDVNSNAIEFDGKNGDKVYFDKNGNITDLKNKDNDWTIRYDSNGKPISGFLKFKNGTTGVVNPDGTIKVTYPDGTTYVTDDLGNVFRDGLQIEENGQWIEDPEEEEEEAEEEEEEEEEQEESDGPKQYVSDEEYAAYRRTIDSLDIVIEQQQKEVEEAMKKVQEAVDELNNR